MERVIIRLPIGHYLYLLAILLELCLYIQHFSRYWPVTEFQSPEIFEIMDTKHIGVTTLTIQGHVM